MCVVSMIGDHYGDQIRTTPWLQPYLQPSQPLAPPDYTILGQQLSGPPVSRQEFNALKAQVGEMVLLLKRAKLYDEKNGEPDCEIEEKMELLRKVARLVGIDLDAQVAGKAASA